ncbi:p53-like transcription factor [Rhizopus microsporus ATCC 52813]|uniref:p53-like transcription factor n=2 Tax=Rhizopus microsporus TaxID=58291 RepID=A0A2G4SVM5_RHIZD|nr:p53-like transcription factor [Rhizopus microsporus ATCC 52813]PHZ12833.1 p53-like transcription factor [Rhizopus microsporus ATCC 52813]
MQQSKEWQHQHQQQQQPLPMTQQTPMESTKPGPSSSPKSESDHYGYLRQLNNNSSNRYEQTIMARSQPSTPHPYPMTQMIKSTRSHFNTQECSPRFLPTKSMANLLLSDKSTLSPIQIQAKMDRGFFLADDEWTCYRRNYFQVSAVFSLASYPEVYYVQTHRGPQYVQRFLIGLSARVANSDRDIELVQQTPKRDKGPQYNPTPKPVVPGGYLSSGNSQHEAHPQQTIATFERLQFKSATANNGKRRAAQQYFVCVVSLYAETKDQQELIQIASCQSVPLVVRGRSPGHYADTAKTSSSPVTPVMQVNDSYYYYHPVPYYPCEESPSTTKLPYEPYDWQRARYNSTSSSGSSSVTSPHQPSQESYFPAPPHPLANVKQE